MYKVYQIAVEVLIWLGGADETNDLAMDTISRIQKVIRTIGDHPEDFSRAFARNGLVPPDDHVWSATAKLCNRPWAQRLWIMQEVVLARELSVFCGLVGMKWDTIARFCFDLEAPMTVLFEAIPVDPKYKRIDNFLRQLFEAYEHT
jgi:Heterokaryon incompatibility protein (HET)